LTDLLVVEGEEELVECDEEQLAANSESIAARTTARIRGCRNRCRINVSVE
jgi:hypothetical protein